MELVSQAGPRVAEAFAAATRLVSVRLSADLRELRLPQTRLAWPAHAAILGHEALLSHEGIVQEHGELLPDEVRIRLEVGALVSAGTYARALAFRGRWQRMVQASFAECDVLMLPTLPFPPPRIHDMTAELGCGAVPVRTALTRLTAPFNLSGHPAVSLPVRSDDPRVPLSIQLVGPLHQDSRLLGVARSVERVLAPPTC